MTLHKQIFWWKKILFFSSFQIYHFLKVHSMSLHYSSFLSARIKMRQKAYLVGGHGIDLNGFFFSLISEQIANLCIQYNLIYFSPDYHYSTCLWSCSWRWRNWTRSTAHGCDEFRPRPLDLYSFPKRNSHIAASCCGDGNKTEAKHIAKTFPKSRCLRSTDFI